MFPGISRARSRIGPGSLATVSENPSNLTLLWRLVVATLPSVLFTLQSRVDGTLAGPPNKDMQVQESKASQYYPGKKVSHPCTY